jgi:hypothetical protein
MIDLTGVQRGAKLRIIGGIIAEVLESVNDEWVRVRLVEVPERKGTVGTEELCHATDVVEMVSA